MTKVFCDRCKLECEGLGWRLYLTKEGLDVSPNTVRSEDLCQPCVAKLTKWLDYVEPDSER
jgi:hypothetical protein